LEEFVPNPVLASAFALAFIFFKKAIATYF
jgi:hypothetical protein